MWRYVRCARTAYTTAHSRRASRLRLRRGSSALVRHATLQRSKRRDDGSLPCVMCGTRSESQPAVPARRQREQSRSLPVTRAVLLGDSAEEMCGGKIVAPTSMYRSSAAGGRDMPCLSLRGRLDGRTAFPYVDDPRLQHQHWTIRNEMRVRSRLVGIHSTHRRSCASTLRAAHARAGGIAQVGRRLYMERPSSFHHVRRPGKPIGLLHLDTAPALELPPRPHRACVFVYSPAFGSTRVNGCPRPAGI